MCPKQNIYCDILFLLYIHLFCYKSIFSFLISLKDGMDITSAWLPELVERTCCKNVNFMAKKKQTKGKIVLKLYTTDWWKQHPGDKYKEIFAHKPSEWSWMKMKHEIHEIRSIFSDLQSVQEWVVGSGLEVKSKIQNSSFC